MTYSSKRYLLAHTLQVHDSTLVTRMVEIGNRPPVYELGKAAKSDYEWLADHVAKEEMKQARIKQWRRGNQSPRGSTPSRRSSSVVPRIACTPRRGEVTPRRPETDSEMEIESRGRDEIEQYFTGNHRGHEGEGNSSIQVKSMTGGHQVLAANSEEDEVSPLELSGVLSAVESDCDEILNNPPKEFMEPSGDVVQEFKMTGGATSAARVELSDGKVSRKVEKGSPQEQRRVSRLPKLQIQLKKIDHKLPSKPVTPPPVAAVKPPRSKYPSPPRKRISMAQPGPVWPQPFGVSGRKPLSLSPQGKTLASAVAATAAAKYRTPFWLKQCIGDSRRLRQLLAVRRKPLTVPSRVEKMLSVARHLAAISHQAEPPFTLESMLSHRANALPKPDSPVTQKPVVKNLVRSVIVQSVDGGGVLVESELERVANDLTVSDVIRLAGQGADPYEETTTATEQSSASFAVEMSTVNTDAENGSVATRQVEEEKEKRKRERYAAAREECEKEQAKKSQAAQFGLRHSQAADFVDAVLACPSPWRIKDVVTRLRAGRFRWMPKEIMEGHISVILRTMQRTPQLHQEFQMKEAISNPGQPVTSSWSLELTNLLRAWPAENLGE